MEEAVLSEIAERHAFFERWFNGVAADGELAASLAHFDPAFRRIDPAGRLFDFDRLAESLAARRNSHAGSPIAIALEDARVLWREGASALATYVEVQTSDGRVNRRRASALFVSSGAAEGALWRHIHETRIQAGSA